MAELSAFVSADETDCPSSDSSTSDSDDSESEFREECGGVANDKTRGRGGGKFSFFSKLRFGSASQDKYRPLSVQSGDIVHVNNTNSPPAMHGPRPPTATTTKHVTCTTTIEIPSAQLNAVDDRADTEREVREKGGVYGVLFPVVHLVVRGLFYHERFSLVPIFMLGLHFLLTLMFVLLAVFAYPPTLNLSVKAFTIPNHPSQIHWDAFNAAKEGNIWNDSIAQDSLGTDVVYGKQNSRSKNILKRNIIEGCQRDPNVRYQTYLHIYWELDLVFRVPKGNPDRNVLTEKRIRRIHEIEEHIYNLPDYKDFCHKSNGASFCDPINSLLTWLYPRNRQDGSFVYNPDHFTPNLNESLLQLKSNYTNALWFTAGQVTVINSTTFVAELLRSQVRVGLPFPCFTYTGNRRSDGYYRESELVTEFFVSLIPYLESASTSDLEVLYGGPNIYEYEVESASLHDVYLAIASLVLVLVLAFVMSGFSLWLTLTALYAIASSFPLAFFVYTKIFGINTVGLLNLVSLFVIIGIGVDDILVFINTFKQSSRLTGLNTVHERITHTIIEASKATFFTSITTSVAFFANAISSIPAVYQFGVFMGLIVISCYVQVVLVIPFALHIWQSYFLFLENLVYSPCSSLCCKKNNISDDLPAVRMVNRSTEDGDSGIEIMGNGNGSSEQSDNSSTASSSSVSDTNVVIPESEIKEPELDNEPNVVNDTNTNEHGYIATGHHNEEVNPLINNVEIRVSDVIDPLLADMSFNVSHAKPSSKSSAESRWTELQQIGMMKFIARPVMFSFLIGSKFSSKHAARLVSLSMVFLFIAVLMSSWMATAFLKPTDRPPQFFKPSSNIQKMLDLTGNLTDTEAVNCYSCSAWYGGGAIPTVKPPSSVPPSSQSSGSPPTQPSKATPSNTAAPKPPNPTTSHHGNQQPQTPSTDPTKTTPTHHTSSHISGTTNSHPSNQDPVTNPTVGLPTSAPSNQSPSSSSHVTVPPTPAGPGTNENVIGNQYSNNAIVYVVFGISSIKRKYDASHVIPEEGDGDFAKLDSKFNSSFTCPPRGGPTADLVGTVRALCRLCKNLSNPDNGLVLKDNYECFALSALSKLSCFSSVVNTVTECRPFLLRGTPSKVTVKAEAGVLMNPDGSSSLHYLAMAFRSTSNPGENPFTSMNEYQKWEDFLASEIREISKNKALYGSAHELLSSAFQTGEYWVQVNIELVAVYGSIYGILISFSLCSLVVAVLSHNWRLVLSMFLTIMSILFSLLGIFSMLGWTLGIVEAVSLSILVGNALDYCIHLSEGYMAVDSRHLAFVERFKFTAGASMRVKKVMASISFIGVSIISSAITTIVAIFPLLGTWIQLFTRFGAILLIETLVAIVYTLIFCSTFLGLLGPLKTKLHYRIGNALATIFGTILFYVFGLFAIFIATRAGVVIPGPDGSPLFS